MAKQIRVGATLDVERRTFDLGFQSHRTDYVDLRTAKAFGVVDLSARNLCAMPLAFDLLDDASQCTTVNCGCTSIGPLLFFTRIQHWAVDVGALSVEGFSAILKIHAQIAGLSPMNVNRFRQV